MRDNNVASASRDFEKRLDRMDGGQISTRRRTNGSKRQSLGAFFTPAGVIAYSVKRALDTWLCSLDNKQSSCFLSALINLKILDPAIGSGLFLFGCRQYLREITKKIPVNVNIPSDVKIKESGITESDASRVGSTWDRWIVENILWGIDVNPEALQVSRTILQNGLENNPPEVNLLEANTLTTPIHTVRDWLNRKSDRAGWDVVIGNPPWGTEIPVSSNLDFSACKGESALAFCQIANHLTKGKGIITFVLPSSWLQATSWTDWRKNRLPQLLVEHIYILPHSTFPQVTFTAPPIVVIFGIATDTISCEKLILDDDSHGGMIDGKLFPSIHDYCSGAVTNSITSIYRKEIANFPAFRIPIASRWWIDTFYRGGEDKESISNFAQNVVRGLKTGNNKKFIKKYSHEKILDFERSSLRGFSGDVPQWTWLAKGGYAKIKGKPTYFVQQKTHIVRWDVNAVQEYFKSNGLRNSRYYGITGVGFPSSGRHSPVFRYVSHMVFDADYVVIIPKKEDYTFLLLSMCNSPAFLYAAKHLFNHTTHFKMKDLLDMYFPKITPEQQSQLIQLAQQMLDAVEEGDVNAECLQFRTIHNQLVESWKMPSTEEKKCINWYIKRFPGMKHMFD